MTVVGEGGRWVGVGGREDKAGRSAYEEPTASPTMSRADSEDKAGRNDK